MSTGRIARASARHPWKTLGFWLILLVLGGFLASGIGDVLNNDEDFTNNPDSKIADHLIDDRMPKENDSETVVVRSTTLTVDDAAFKQAVEQTVADLKGMTDVVASASSYYDALAAGSPDAESMVSADRHATVIPVGLNGTSDDLEDEAEAYVTLAQSQATNEIEVYTVGDLSGDHFFDAVVEDDLAKSETVGLPVALVVLIVVFGALIAAGLPILLGLASIAVATGATALVARVMTITDEATTMITMIGLAVGIDYALFVIERYREERRHGLAKYDAIERAGATAGKAVIFSGATVVLALVGMFLLPVTVFHSLAVGAIMVVIASVLATQTLLPAMIGLIGDKINFPRRPKYATAPIDRHAVLNERSRRGFWGAITRVVMARPRVSLGIALVILVVLAAPVFRLQTGFAGLDTIPESDLKSGYEILQSDFYAGTVAPVEIVVDGQTTDPAVTAGIDNLLANLKQLSIYGPAEIETSPNNDLTVITVPFGVDPDSQRAYDAIGDLRDTLIPAAFGDLASSVHVTGDSASSTDFNTILQEDTPKVFAFVLGLSFLLLLMAFRSIVVPVTSILMNLLSVGAAYGLLVLVFQEGVGDGLLGLQQTESITPWVPVFLFCILFGLSMDYHVFLLSRIREHYDATRNNSDSVAVGLQSTAKIITGAALIMVAVFSAFAAGRITDMQQMGFGLAVAVFLDATIVRSVLVPATMTLLGDKNWYLPRILRWLPDLRIEGEPIAATTPAPTPAAQAPVTAVLKPNRSLDRSPFESRF
jgi:RND superfamily putative drug exporter